MPTSVPIHRRGPCVPLRQPLEHFCSQLLVAFLSPRLLPTSLLLLITMEFTPFKFINEVIEYLIKSPISLRASPYCASLPSDLSSYWGERAKLQSQTFFDLSLHFCRPYGPHSPLSASISGSSSVSFDFQASRIIRDPSIYLRNLIISGSCRCQALNFSAFNINSIFAVLSDYMKTTSVVCNNVVISLEAKDCCEVSQLGFFVYPFLKNDLRAQKIHIKVWRINNMNSDFLQQVLKSNMVASLEYSDIGALPEDFLIPYTQNDVLRLATYPTNCAQTHGQEIIKKWVRNPRRENCSLIVFDVMTREVLSNTLETVIAEISRLNPTIVVNCKPMQDKKKTHAIMVSGCEKQMIVHWTTFMVARGFIKLEKSERLPLS